MPYSLIIDVLVAVLLVVTIAYAIVLNRRLGMLRRDKAELEKVALSFGEATRRAEESIARLKTTAGGLEENIAKAQSLRDDLAFLMDRGSSAADRLEDLIRDSRKQTGGPVPPTSARTAVPATSLVADEKGGAVAARKPAAPPAKPVGVEPDRKSVV